MRKPKSEGKYLCDFFDGFLRMVGVIGVYLVSAGPVLHAMNGATGSLQLAAAEGPNAYKKLDLEQ